MPPEHVHSLVAIITRVDVETLIHQTENKDRIENEQEEDVFVSKN
jgi:hypothetical protein